MISCYQPDVQVPQLRIPGVQGGIQSFGGSGVQRGPGLSFINSASQLPGQQSAMSTNYHQRYGSALAQQLSPKV